METINPLLKMHAFVWAEGLRQGTGLQEGTDSSFQRYLAKNMPGGNFVPASVLGTSEEPAPFRSLNIFTYPQEPIVRAVLSAASFQQGGTGTSCPLICSSLRLGCFLRAKHRLVVSVPFPRAR